MDAVNKDIAAAKRPVLEVERELKRMKTLMDELTKEKKELEKNIHDANEESMRHAQGDEKERRRVVNDLQTRIAALEGDLSRLKEQV